MPLVPVEPRAVDDVLVDVVRAVAKSPSRVRGDDGRDVLVDLVGRVQPAVDVPGDLASAAVVSLRNSRRAHRPPADRRASFAFPRFIHLDHRIIDAAAASGLAAV